MSFTIDIDTSELRHGWRDALEVLDRGCDAAVLAAVNEGAAVAHDQHTYRRQTGALEDATQGHMTGHAEGEIVALQRYASFVEDGTAAHIIRPKARAGFVGPLQAGQSRRKRGTGGPRAVLAWEGGDGTMHFAAVVHHPGTPPLPFMGPAGDKAELVLEREMEATIPLMQQAIDR